MGNRLKERRKSMRGTFKAILSFLLIAGGVFLLFLGARDYLDSRVGQSVAAREFERPVPDTADTRVAATSGMTPAKHLSIRLGDTLAKLKIPRLDTELYVLEGDDPGELRRGPGHLAGTAMPGADGNCVIAGHRDTHFRVLKDIREGDDIVLQTATGQYLYRVKRTQIVWPDNTSALQPTSDAQLNLITCYPFYYVGSAPKRFVVEAQLAGAVRRPS
jgi:sortase A